MAPTPSPFNDTIEGNSSDNTIFSLGGSDTVRGRNGNDRLFGDRRPVGFVGNVGIPGNDSLDGGNGNDSLYGDEGRDTLRGGNNKDFLFGGRDNDLLDGGNGNDSLNGGSGNDKLIGGDGYDTLLGDTGKDRLVGVNPLEANPGSREIDRLTGGSEADRFVLGDANKIYYDESGPILAPGPLPPDTPPLIDGYALITDFTPGVDTVELKGGVKYDLRDVNLGNGVSGVGIYIDSTNPSVADERIGVLQGVNPFSLKINNGSNITTITGFDLKGP
jgi:Ca2+-binding RTX toxin-like protein